MRTTLLLTLTLAFNTGVHGDFTAFPICTTDGYQVGCSVCGSTVVWTDYRSGNNDVYGYDLDTNTEFEISTASWSESSPSIDGNIVAWVDYGYPNQYSGDICAMDGNTGMIDCVNAQNQVNGTPAVSGNLVVWADYRWDGRYYYGICGYDLTTQMELRIGAVSNSEKSYPAINGHIVVWEDWRNGNYDIYAYDLVSQTEFPICTADGDQYAPKISGNTVVWQDYRNGNGDIYAFDLDTKTEVALCTDSGDQGSPAVSGEFIVWQDHRNNDPDIYGCDLDDLLEFPICTEPGDQYGPSISGDVVVWVNSRDSGVNDDIYGAFLDLRKHASSDQCQDPPYVTDREAFLGTNRFATGSDISSCGFNDSYDVWNRYTPSQGGTVTITTDNSTFDTVLSVYEGCGGAELACNDDYSFDNPWSQVVMNVVRGKTYYIRVAGFNGEVGDYDLLITRGACASQPQSDLTGDCRVNLEDFLIFASEWLTCGFADPTDC